MKNNLKHIKKKNNNNKYALKWQKGILCNNSSNQRSICDAHNNSTHMKVCSNSYALSNE